MQRTGCKYDKMKFVLRHHDSYNYIQIIIDNLEICL